MKVLRETSLDTDRADEGITRIIPVGQQFGSKTEPLQYKMTQASKGNIVLFGDIFIFPSERFKFDFQGQKDHRIFQDGCFRK